MKIITQLDPIYFLFNFIIDEIENWKKKLMYNYLTKIIRAWQKKSGYLLMYKVSTVQT
jgi:hypothetical protein